MNLKTLNKTKRRFTKQRSAILQYLQTVTCHPDAEKIYKKLRPKMPNLSLGTVYRNLRDLSENNQILEINTADGVSHFDGNITEHLHFICRCCGVIYDVWKKYPWENKNLPDIGRIEKIECNFYGTCHKCGKV
ncbi:MAG: transcriptional repressor [Patescibacteria group bacterium]